MFGGLKVPSRVCSPGNSDADAYKPFILCESSSHCNVSGISSGVETTNVDASSVALLPPECCAAGTVTEVGITTTSLSPLSGSSGSDVDIQHPCLDDFSNAHITPSEMIKSSFVRNTFWSDFVLTRSKADGHCIVHSIASCLNHLHDSTYNVDLMLQKIVAECDNFIMKYNCYWPENLNFHEEMKKYVYLKEYKLLFCEFVTTIMANALNHIIIVINVETLDSCSPMDVYDYIPDDYIDRKPVCNQCGLKLGTLVLLRRVNHYDACVQRSKVAKPCSCNISAPHL